VQRRIQEHIDGGMAVARLELLAELNQTGDGTVDVDNQPDRLRVVAPGKARCGISPPAFHLRRAVDAQQRGRVI
jgi:hypothetical protein